MHFRLGAVVLALLLSGVGIAANVIISPNMGMPVPVVGTDPGPDWANNINASLSIIDSHDHTTGHGVPVPSAGLNINADLPFNSNNATTLRSSRYAAQSAPISGGSDLGAVYVSGVDLYYNDGAGNQVRITQGGSVTGSAGTITGLPSGTASASFAAGAFTFQSATNTPATMNVGPLKVGTSTVSPHTVTIAPPGGLAANYNLTLPNGLPVATSVLQVSSLGAISSLATTGTGNAVLSASPTLTGTITATGATITGVALSGATIGDATLSTPSVFSGTVKVAGAGADVTPITLQGGTTTGVVRETFQPSSGASFFQIITDFGSSPTVMRISSDAASPISVQSTGNVGIGSATPTVALDVVGAIKASSTGGNVPHSCTRRTNSVSGSGTTATCSAGEIVVGGGCTESGTNALTDSLPVTASSWQCVWTGSSTVTAYAICCAI